MIKRLPLVFLVLGTWLGASASAETPPKRAQKVLFLHHSTGENIWNGGLAEWLKKSNAARKTSYQITERAFPKAQPYGWNNYPYDYWNIWVKHAGSKKFKDEPTLELLAGDYDLIVFKHCFPVSNIKAGGRGDVASEEKTVANYKLQYQELKKKLQQFPKTKFLVWTGAMQVRAELSGDEAKRAREFFDWVRWSWDQRGDNVFVWDFYQLETGGGFYLKPEHAVSSKDSHPNPAFSRRVAPLLGQRIVDVLEGRGDTGSITGK